MVAPSFTTPQDRLAEQSTTIPDCSRATTAPLAECVTPAQRASRVDPMLALRDE
jgi:hypothetical protein